MFSTLLHKVPESNAHWVHLFSVADLSNPDEENRRPHAGTFARS
jgi:hypothetical protein